jgi:hypothetical protein
MVVVLAREHFLAHIRLLISRGPKFQRLIHSLLLDKNEYCWIGFWKDCVQRMNFCRLLPRVSCVSPLLLISLISSIHY